MATAFYEVRNVQWFSPTHVRLEARFEASDGDGCAGSGTRLTFSGSDPDGWETVDINPFVSEADLHRQLRDIAAQKDSAFRLAKATEEASRAFVLHAEPYAVPVSEGLPKPTG